VTKYLGGHPETSASSPLMLSVRALQLARPAINTTIAVLPLQVYVCMEEKQGARSIEFDG
jgi:hypothetical protein